MTENSKSKIGGILLAAGGSSRLGQPKQLLQFKGKTLIRRAAEALVGSGCCPIVVVLGAEIECSTAELEGLEVNICINDNWQVGMSSSIVSGLERMLEIEPNLDAAVITLCDQPNVSSVNIDKLLTAFRVSSLPIVAARYGETIGVPALFYKEIFHQLFELTGDKGARQIIQNHIEIVDTVAIEKAAVDIDCLDDVNRLTFDEIVL